MTSLLSYPALTGDVVTEGHARICRERGHATHMVDSVDTGMCPRCGEVTIPANSPTPAARTQTEELHMRYTVAYTRDDTTLYRGEPVSLPGEYASERAARDMGIRIIGESTYLIGQSSAGEWAWADSYGRSGYLYVYAV